MSDIDDFTYVAENLKELSVSEIKARLQPVINGNAIFTETIPAGTIIYRARKFDETFSKSQIIQTAQLSYPSPMQASIGRLNREGESLFYGSMLREPVIYELMDLNKDDHLVLSEWETTADMMLYHMGCTRTILKRMQPYDNILHVRQNPVFPDNIPHQVEFLRTSLTADQKTDLIALCAERVIDYKIHDAFIRPVKDKEDWYYKLSIALRELHADAVQNQTTECIGSIYPSAQSWPTGDNLAILSHHVDDYIAFKTGYELRVDQVSPNCITATICDVTNDISQDNLLKWKNENYNTQHAA